MAGRCHPWRWWEIDTALVKLNREFELVESVEYDRYRDAIAAWRALPRGNGYTYFLCRLTRLQNDEVDCETLDSK